MVRRKYMTHEEHVELAKILSCVRPALQQALITTGNKLGVTSKAHKNICKVMNVYDSARSALDSEYHRVTSNTQFADKGHVYYSSGVSE
jgi:hypothetical protein